MQYVRLAQRPRVTSLGVGLATAGTQLLAVRAFGSVVKSSMAARHIPVGAAQAKLVSFRQPALRGNARRANQPQAVRIACPDARAADQHAWRRVAWRVLARDSRAVVENVNADDVAALCAVVRGA